jgi:hypothetical protein
VHNRIRNTLDEQQADDQMGFRSKRGTDDALIVLESVVGKCIEFNIPLWFVSLDLRMAFDRIEWPQLFSALEDQPRGYRSLPNQLYGGQCGFLASGDTFPILRGFRQGDILSPLLFNAGLEQAVRRWKLRLRSHGIKIDDNERLTNVRFAADLIIYAHSAGELSESLSMLAEELRNIGLELNAEKTKIFTNDSKIYHSEKPIHVDAAQTKIDVVRARDVHKYLGIAIRGDLTYRGKSNLSHRLHVCLDEISSVQGVIIEYTRSSFTAAATVRRDRDSVVIVRTRNSAIDCT